MQMAVTSVIMPPATQPSMIKVTLLLAAALAAGLAKIPEPMTAPILMAMADHFPKALESVGTSFVDGIDSDI